VLCKIDSLRIRAGQGTRPRSEIGTRLLHQRPKRSKSETRTDTARMPQPLSSTPDFVERLRSASTVIRFRPFDTSTEHGRSKERYRRATLTATASVLAKGASLV